MQHTISKRLAVITILGVLIVGGYYLLNKSARSPVDRQAGEAPQEQPLYSVQAAEGLVTDVNQSKGQLLYLASAESASDGIGGGGHMQGKDLIVKDVNTGEKKTIAKDVIEAKFSPDATKVVVANADDEVLLLDSHGTQLAKLGKHGSGPIFSNDGRSIVYHRLADEGEGQKLFEHSPFGLVQYDIEKKSEKVLTENKDDYLAIGFSADMKKLYFNSARAYEPIIDGFENHVISFWVLDIPSEKVTRLTNLREDDEWNGNLIPSVSQNALWSTDRLTIISEADGEIWKFELTLDGDLESAKKISAGYSPVWAVLDQSINIQSKQGDDSSWRVINLK